MVSTVVPSEDLVFEVIKERFGFESDKRMFDRSSETESQKKI